MSEVGIDIKDSTVKQLSTDLLDMSDKIVVLCGKDKCPKAITERKGVLYKYVEDPPDNIKTLVILRIMRDKVRRIVEELE